MPGADRQPAGRPERRPLHVHVAALRTQSGATRRERREVVVSDLAGVSVAVPEDEAVVVDVTLASDPGGILATGTVSASWRGECRRCGGPVRGTVVTEVRERYAPAGGPDGDDDAYPLSGDELDLGPLVRDAVLLELPLAPLCGDGCLGLCPWCGADRNAEACECTPPGDPRWSALDVLRDREAST